jgi:ubiquinone/menaquinone biosynthesis C-methylase UbiE
MLEVAANAVPTNARTLVDIGTGTGALAARCLEHAPRARVVGIDADEAMVQLASRRLGDHASFVVDSFLRAAIPPCDAIVSSFALHHVRTRDAKRRLYRRFRAALRPNGRLVLVDCQPSSRRQIASAQHAAWLAHLRRTYSPRRARLLLEAWGDEDVYVPLDDERALMADARLRSEVLWRRGAFAVLVAGR